MVLSLATAATAADFDATEFWKEPVDLPFDVTVLEQGQDTNIAWQAMVYTSETYNGQPMRIFAWYAWPKSDGKHPAVVSVHGGGGGADLPRAQAFARAGYACLAFDWNGWRDPVVKWKEGDPLPAASNTIYTGINYDGWVEHFCYPSPEGDWKWPEQYRAVTSARRAVTWMSQRPEVDADKIVAEGHSWGGMLTQLLAGLEPRLKATAVSASAGAWASRYKAGQEGHTKGLKPEQAEQYFQRFDPASFTDRIGAPILLRLGTTDFFASVDNLMEYWDRIKAPKSLELLPASNHTFYDVETRVAWFNHWLNKAPAFPRLESVTVAPGQSGEWKVIAKATGPAPIEKAMVAWTTSSTNWYSRRLWVSHPLAAGADGTWTGSFAPVAAGGPLRSFVTVQDANGHAASSLPVVQDMPAAKAPIPAPLLYANLPAAKAKKSPFKAPKQWKRATEAGPIAAGAETVGEQSFRIGALWNADALYLRLPVRDSTPWQDGDGVQLRLATVAATNQPPASTLQVQWSPGTNGTIRTAIVRSAKPGITETNLLELDGDVQVEPGTGYTLSAGIPWSFLSTTLKPAKGDTVEFAISISYRDYITSEPVATIELNRYDPSDKSERKRIILE